MRSLQAAWFCKKIKFGEGHEAGRWEGVEGNLDIVRSLQTASRPRSCWKDGGVPWQVPRLNVEKFCDTRVQGVTSGAQCRTLGIRG